MFGECNILVVDHDTDGVRNLPDVFVGSPLKFCQTTDQMSPVVLTYPLKFADVKRVGALSKSAALYIRIRWLTGRTTLHRAPSLAMLRFLDMKNEIRKPSVKGACPTTYGLVSLRIIPATLVAYRWLGIPRGFGLDRVRLVLLCFGGFLTGA